MIKFKIFFVAAFVALMFVIESYAPVKSTVRFVLPFPDR